METKIKIILLVEDNISDIELTKRALKKTRILNPLIVCEDGNEVMDYFNGTGRFEGRNTSEMPSVVLLDIKLPIMDGHEILKWIRNNATTRNLPVVMLTSSKEEQDISKSYDLGANSYIRKPVDMAQFTECIKQLGLYWLIMNELPHRT